ncbi:MAG TPA: type II toxin-antitoxin system RelE/ParE family toxin [Verrucomicrobiae bacterium]|nr:type II toxin-antitoxin system RelE/ParE family toxin [Verrucomicrobiae bacterium]
MAARIEYKASVARDLRKLSHAAAVRVLLKVERMLASEGYQGEALSREFAGLYKLRVGDYRVIYARTEKGFLVLRIGHREDVYRKGPPEVN